MTTDLRPAVYDAFAAELVEQSDRREVPAAAVSESLPVPQLANASTCTEAGGGDHHLGPKSRGRSRWRRLLSLFGSDAEAETPSAEVTQRLFRAGLHHLR